MDFLNKIEINGIVGMVHKEKIADTNVLRFSVVTEQTVKDKNENITIETFWCNCVAYNVQEQSDEWNINKGDYVKIEGRLRSVRCNDMNGNVRYSVEAVISKLETIKKQGNI